MTHELARLQQNAHLAHGMLFHAMCVCVCVRACLHACMRNDGTGSWLIALDGLCASCSRSKIALGKITGLGQVQKLKHRPPYRHAHTPKHTALDVCTKNVLSLALLLCFWGFVFLGLQTSDISVCQTMSPVSHFLCGCSSECVKALLPPSQGALRSLKAERSSK